MAFKTSVDVQINTKGIMNRYRSNKFGMFIAATVHKHFTPAMPYRTGAFAETVTIQPFQYTHNVPYASSVYNANRSFRRDKHPMAMSRYVEGYGHVALPKITKDAQAFINRGGI